MAKVHYEADGAVAADEFIAALTDFGPSRPEMWPNLDAKYYELHELGDTWADVTEGSEFLGGVWARERYDWSSRDSFAFGSAKRSTSTPARRSCTGLRACRAAAATSPWTSSGSRPRSAGGSSVSWFNSRVLDSSAKILA